MRKDFKNGNFEEKEVVLIFSRDLSFLPSESVDCILTVIYTSGVGRALGSLCN